MGTAGDLSSFVDFWGYGTAIRLIVRMPTAMKGKVPTTVTTVAPTGRSAVKDNHNPMTEPNRPSAHPRNKRAISEFAINDALNAGMIRKANTSKTPAMLTARVMTTANEAKNRNSQRKLGGCDPSAENDKA